jgi:hypothetical protein
MIEKLVWHQKSLVTGMIDYHENRSKAAPNSNFVFEKLRIGKPIGMTGLPIDMTDKSVPKQINRLTDNG